VVGNDSVPFVGGPDVKKIGHRLGRILTDSKLRVKKAGNAAEVYLDVFALGDAADIEGHSLPTTAEVAVRNAKYLVQRLNKGPKGPETQLKPFSYTDRILVFYIRGRDWITQESSVNEPWSGQQAWLSWRIGSFTWTRTWRNWVGIIIAVIMNALFGKDIMR